VRGIRYAGFVDGPEKATRLGAARWLVMPSHWQEPFGLAALEARSLGVPCIATRDGGLPEAAGRDALYCEPADVDGLAERLREAAAMPEAEYAARADRTRAEAAADAVPPRRYADLYLELAGVKLR
jgi:glycosyltransferase involved in cell wall biosynthesis